MKTESDLIMIRHNLCSFERNQALTKVPAFVKKCAKQGLLIVAMPECAWWIGRKVEPFDIDALETVVVEI